MEGGGQDPLLNAANVNTQHLEQFKPGDQLSSNEDVIREAPHKTTENRRKEVEKNRSNKSIGNESQKLRQLSSHNDSFEYTVMNLQKRSNTRNWRLFLIRHVLLPQRTKRIYLNTIHSIFSADFKNLCSTNLLNFFVTAIVLVVLVHIIWIIVAIYKALQGNAVQLDG